MWQVVRFFIFINLCLYIVNVATKYRPSVHKYSVETQGENCKIIGNKYSCHISRFIYDIVILGTYNALYPVEYILCRSQWGFVSNSPYSHSMCNSEYYKNIAKYILNDTRPYIMGISITNKKKSHNQTEINKSHSKITTGYIFHNIYYH